MIEVVVGDVRIAARGLLDLLHRMLLDAGVQAPAAELALPDETLPGEPVPVPGETRPFGLLFADEEDEDAIIVVGQNLKLDFFAEGSRVEIDSVEELRLEGGGVVGGKVINGDERLTVVPVDRVGAARIRLLRLPVD